MEILKGKNPIPPRIVLYGTEGIGKSTWPNTPETLYIDIEGGLNSIDCQRLPRGERLEDFDDQLSWIWQERPKYKTICIDSLDWLQIIIEKKICEDAGVPTIAKIGFGVGYSALANAYKLRLERLTKLQQAGYTIVCLAHSSVKRFESPMTDPYDRYSLKLHDKCSALIKEWADAILFVNYKVNVVKKATEQFGKKTGQAIGSGERVIYTSEKPAFDAKNRYSLPEKMDFDFSQVMDAIRNSFK